jgi:glucosamine--fructose-6-phosphate aminotransferase (isomerizing)
MNYGARLMSNKAMVRLGGLEKKADDFMEVDNLIMAACGTSHYATRYAEHIMNKLGCFDYVECKIASEITEDDLRFKNPRQSCMICVSQSGETMDLLIPFRLADKMGLQRLNVVNKVNSTLARENQCGVFLNCGRELSVASTKAYITQVVVLTLVALWFSQRKSYNQTKRMRTAFIMELKNLAGNIKTTLDSCNPFSALMATQLKQAKGILFLGQGIGEAVASEGCLKMKELTYLHCQSFSVSNIANNFYNYVQNNPGMPSIWIVLDSDMHDKEITIQAMRKLQNRQVKTFSIIISDC